MVSAAAQQPIRHDVAMTGEITLTGLVLPIGGLLEKVARRPPPRHQDVRAPERNLDDVEELPEEVRESMTFVPARTLEDVLKVAFGTGESALASGQEALQSATGNRQ